MAKELKLKLQPMSRSVEFDRAKIDVEARTIDLSMSSEMAVERHFGREILDHSPESVDLSRMNSGASVVLEHDGNQHVGAVVRGSARVDAERVLRATVKLGSSPLAKQVLQDVVDGIRGLVSVRYRIDRMEKTGEEDGVGTFRASRWAPIHVSFVSDPADPTVGVGRGETAEQYELLVGDRNIMADEAKPVAQVTAPEPPNLEIIRQGAADTALKGERLRHNTIHEIADNVSKRHPDVADLAKQAIRDGTNVDAFRQLVLEKIGNATPVQAGTSEIGMNRKELSQYSLVRAIGRLANKQDVDGLELEASRATAKIIGRDPEGFYIPTDVAMESRRYGQADRALTTNVFSAAGALVGVESMSLIEILRNSTVLSQLGVTSLSGLVGNVAIPRQSGGATAYWVAEGATITASAQTVQQLSLTPHQLSAATAYTKQLLNQSSIDIENFVRSDLMAVIAIERDKQALVGLGTTGQPLGLLYTTGIGTIDCTGTVALTWANIVAFEENLEANNANTGSPKWLFNTYAKSIARGTLKETYGSTMLWDATNMVAGSPAIGTNLTPVGKGSVIYGNWADMIVADWAGLDVVVDPYSLSLQSQIRIILSMYVDNGLRHPASFCVSVL